MQNAGYYQFFQEHLKDREIIILSEGLVHRATSLFARPFEEPNEKEILKYVKLLPQVDLLIWVDTPRHICMERIGRGRGHGRYSGEELARFVEKGTISIRMDFRKKVVLIIEFQIQYTHCSKFPCR